MASFGPETKRVVVWVSEVENIAPTVSECIQKHPGAFVKARNSRFFDPKAPGSRASAAYVVDENPDTTKKIADHYKAAGVDCTILKPGKADTRADKAGDGEGKAKR